ncbi:MAG: trehalose 6-phosphate synthase [Solirubrobacteraceae bacterium]|jgi:trehalose 6-phosphate synthase|nr:trehalose 6-phosphate synthase [Solirubrobacteraceae bacterium]
MSTPPLVLVSNRGPVTFQDDGSVRRGTGGLVTALTGLASHRDATWIASTMSPGDAAASAEAGGRPIEVSAPEGGTFNVRLVESDPDAYDRFYNIFANPMLWFIQHYLWDQSNAPDIRRHEVEAFELGYQVVNADLAEAVLDEIDGVSEPVVMVHDYHLYTLPKMLRRARPDVFLHHFIHIPWTQSDAWRVLPAHIRDEIFTGLLANDIIGLHTKSYRRNFLQCCVDLLGLEVDSDRGVVYYEDREIWVRAYPLPIDWEATQALAARPRVAEFEEKLLRRRRDYSILRVDRADLSKNILRGFTGFDIFLDQHPEFHERITFTAQLMPSRTDVPEYAEYLERIEALVAVVNHRHGTPDWMPIDLKLRDDLEEAVASYKHYDVIMVNAMFDGMNLVAKEAALVNERDGVCLLSENTGAHEELGEWSLTVNPFDVQELADCLYMALTMEPDERSRRAGALKEILTSRDPGDWVDNQLEDIRAKARGEDAAVVSPPPVTRRG